MTEAAISWPKRILGWAPVRIVIALVVVMVPIALLGFLFQKLLPAKGLADVKNMIALAVLLGAYWAHGRYIEKRAVGELSLRGALTELAYGLTLGLLLFSAIIGVLAWAGAYQITGFNGWDALRPLVSGFVIGAAIEEIIFRGIVFRILQDAVGSMLALLISGILFGAMHIANPAATLLTSAAIAIEAGLMLGAAYMLTRRLWLCIAIHFAWNIAQGGVYSIPVSGHVTKGVLQAHMSGPDWLTGGAFGAEASLVALAACVLVAVALLAAAWKMGRFVPAPWKNKTV